MKPHFLFFALLFAVSVKAGNTFIGTITYNITYSGEGIDAYSAILPSKIIVYYGAKAASTHIVDGLTPMRTLAKKKKTYVIMDHTETVYEQDNNENTTQPANPTYISLFESEKICGHLCNKYTALTAGANSTVWAAPNLIVPTYSKAIGSGISATPHGLPLKVVSTLSGMTTTLEAISVTAGISDPKQLKIPKGYTVLPFSEYSGF